MRLWSGFSLLLFFLCINKQLDLQTWFTQVLRDLAHAYGLYEQRRRYQKLFIFGVAALGCGGLALAARVLRPIFSRVRLMLASATLLFVFVLIRAASFHGLDAMLYRGPVPLNVILELGALALVIVAAWTAVR